MIRIYDRDFSEAFSIFFIILWTKIVTKLFLNWSSKNQVQKQFSYYSNVKQTTPLKKIISF